MGLCDYRFHPKINEMGPEAQQNNDQSTSDWLGKNELAEKDDLEVKQHELDGVVNPIQVASGAGGSGRGLAPAAPALGADFIRMFGDDGGSVVTFEPVESARLVPPPARTAIFSNWTERNTSGRADHPTAGRAAVVASERHEGPGGGPLGAGRGPRGLQGSSDFFRVFGESADAVMLRKNKLAEKDKFEVKQQELDGIVNPIQAAGGAGSGGGGTAGLVAVAKAAAAASTLEAVDASQATAAAAAAATSAATAAAAAVAAASICEQLVAEMDEFEAKQQQELDGIANPEVYQAAGGLGGSGAGGTAAGLDKNKVAAARAAAATTTLEAVGASQAAAAAAASATSAAAAAAAATAAASLCEQLVAETMLAVASGGRIAQTTAALAEEVQGVSIDLDDMMRMRR